MFCFGTRLFCIVWSVIFWSLSGISAQAERRSIPPLTGPVIDEARLLSGDSVRNLDQAVRYLLPDAQLQIWIVDSLNNEPIESLALRAAETWKLGSASKDNGILCLISVRDRKIRLEVGQGLEGTVTDLKAGRLIRGVMAPHMAKGRPELALQRMIHEIETELRPGLTRTVPHVPSAEIPTPTLPKGFLGALSLFFLGLIFLKSMTSGRWIFFGSSISVSTVAFAVAWTLAGLAFAFLILVPLLFLFLLVAYPSLAWALLQASTSGSRTRRGSWGSSSWGGGGSWSGGGGGFSGGGASGGW